MKGDFWWQCSTLLRVKNLTFTLILGWKFSTLKRVVLYFTFSSECPLFPPPGGGGSLTNGIRGCSKVLRCIFVSLYIDGWVIVTYPRRPICKIGCILENLAKKHPICAKSGAAFFAEKWYRDGSQNHAFRGIEMIEIFNSTLSIPVRFFLKTPPPPGFPHVFYI